MFSGTYLMVRVIQKLDVVIHLSVLIQDSMGIITMMFAK